jgi:hypothetical protein
VVERSGVPRARAVGLDDIVCPGDRVRVGALGRVAVQLANEAGTPIRLDEGTTLTFPAPEPDKPFLLKLIEGVVHVLSRVPQALTIETPIVAANIEGTEFVLGVSEAGAELWVFEGRVRVSNPQGELQVASGEGALHPRAGNRPVERGRTLSAAGVERNGVHQPVPEPHTRIRARTWRACMGGGPPDETPKGQQRRVPRTNALWLRGLRTLAQQSRQLSGCVAGHESG